MTAGSGRPGRGDASPSDGSTRVTGARRSATDAAGREPTRRPAPRSLADDLRARSDPQLAVLVRSRPDLVHPVPADLAALATRAGSPPSVATALRNLDELSLHVLLAAALGPDPTTPAALARALVEAGEPTSTAASAQSLGSAADPSESGDSPPRKPSARRKGLPGHAKALATSPGFSEADAERAGETATEGAAEGAPKRGAARGEDLSRDQVREVVARLREQALLWGTDRSLHVVGAARDLLVPADRGPRIAALDRIVAGYAREPDTLIALVDTAPEAARAALDRLLAGPVVGTVVDARRDPVPERSAVDWLLAHHLIVPLGADRAVVPAEVVTILRARAAGIPIEPLDVASLTPPQPARPAGDLHRVETGAVGAVLDVLHAVVELGSLWADAPPTRVRSGGISQRDLTRTARAMGVSELVAALVIEVAAAAGLLAADSGELLTVLPTPAFDTWLGRDPAEQYAELLVAWLDLPRATAGPGDRPLDAPLALPGLPGLRREVLAALASRVGSWTADGLVGSVRWHAPRRAEPGRLHNARIVFGDLTTLGLVVGGVLTDTGRALLADDGPAVSAALRAVLPKRVDTLVMQADLTAIVPGLPSPELATLMRQAATAESTGAASVYRFSEASLRAALDGGRGAGDLLAELTRRGPVPQPLAYLIEDVARRHASLRIGAVSTYLRCDDPVLIATILADPAAVPLGLFPLSETVLASAQPPEHVLERLRQLGHSPRPEPGRGLEAPAPRRARSRPRSDTPEPLVGTVSLAMAAAAVRAMRASDRPAAAGRADDAAHPVPPGSPAEIAATLRRAVADDAPVWIGYADPTGVTADRQVEPLRVSGGYLTALDLRTEAIQSFALARITGVEPA